MNEPKLNLYENNWLAHPEFKIYNLATGNFGWLHHVEMAWFNLRSLEMGL